MLQISFREQGINLMAAWVKPMQGGQIGTIPEGDVASSMPPLVDVHAHIFHKGMPVSDTAWQQPAAAAPVESFLRTLDEAGVYFGVLAAASIYDDYNDYMISSVREHKRLRATVIVSPNVDPYILRQMNDDGVVGVRLQFRSLIEPPDLSSYDYRKFLRRVADLGWHVHLHDEGERLPLYIKHIEASGPRLVIDHFGRPSQRGGSESEGFKAVLEAVERGNTWVKLSGAFRLASEDVMRQLTAVLLSKAGTERLMWGSDWPFVAHENHMTYAAALGLYLGAVPNARTRREIDMTSLRFYFQ